MPLLFIVAAIGFGIWIAASMAESVLLGFQQHFGYVPGKHIYGIPTDLKGKEFKRALKVIEDWIAEYKSGMKKLVDKYGVKIVNYTMLNSAYFVPKNEWKLYKQSHKEIRDLEETLEARPHPKMLKTDDDNMTFDNYRWNDRKRKVSVVLNEIGLKFPVNAVFH